MKRFLAVVILVLTFFMVAAQPVWASWYAGNYQTSAYGIQANIYTPSSAPYLASSGESNSVTTTAPYWVQTGWRYYKNWANARPYVEYNLSTGYDLTEYGTQSWDTYKNYKLYHSVSGWSVFIDSDLKLCVSGGGLPTTPTTLIAQSEVHSSSSNELDTTFSSVYWRNSNGTWTAFNQDHFFEDSPYHVTDTYYYRFDCYGPEE